MSPQVEPTEQFKQTIEGLSSPVPGIRAACLQALGRMGEEGASVADTAGHCLGLFSDSDLVVQVSAIHAVGKMGQLGALHSDEIVGKLDSKDMTVRNAALRALGDLGERAARHAGAVEKYLADEHPETVADACVALGAMKVHSSAKTLAAKLKNDDETVVISAIMGLSHLDEEVNAVGSLLSHKNARVRASAMNSMHQMTNRDSLAPAIAKCVADADCFVRIEACSLLTQMGEKASGQAKVLTPMLSHDDPGVRALSATSLAGIKCGADDEILAELSVIESLLADGDEDKSTDVLVKTGVLPKWAPEFRKPCCAAAFLLGALGQKAQHSSAKVAAGLSSPDHEMRSMCAQALGKMGGDQFESELVDLLEDPLPMVIAGACNGLGALADLSAASASAGVAEKVAECLEDKSPAVRSAAAQALGKMGDEMFEFIDALVKKMDDPVWSVRGACIDAIASPSSGERGQMYAADICRHMFDHDQQVRIVAIQALTRLGERGAAFAEEVASLLQDPFPEIRQTALRALAAFGPIVTGPWKHEVERVAQEDSLDRVKAEALRTLDSFTALAGIADAE